VIFDAHLPRKTPLFMALSGTGQRELCNVGLFDRRSKEKLRRTLVVSAGILIPQTVAFEQPRSATNSVELSSHAINQ
jgi:hypothetical protein